MIRACTSVSITLPFGPDLVGDEAEGDVVGVAAVLRGLEVHCALVVVPGRLEQLDQVAGRDDLDAERLHQLDRAGIDAARCRGWRCAARTPSPLASAPPTSAADAGLQFLPAAVDGLLPPGRWSSEAGSIAVDELLRLARRGDRR